MFDLTVLLLILIVILFLNFPPFIIYIELKVINLNHQTEIKMIKVFFLLVVLSYHAATGT